MPQTPLATPRFHFRPQTFNPDLQSEQVCYDNPLAIEVAKPLFDAGLHIAALTCRRSHRVSIKDQVGFINNHSLTFLLQGTLKFQSGEKQFDLQPGEVAYCPPGQKFRRYGVEGDVSWWFYFFIEDIPLWAPLKAGGAFVEKYDSIDLMFVLLRRILDAHRSRDLRSISAARSESHMLLTLLRRFRNRQAPEGRQEHDLRELVNRIRDTPSADWTGRWMAEILHVSPRTLLRLFRKEYGCSPMTMVARLRMNQAMDLLTHTDETIPQVAAHCGYASLPSFSRLFRKHVGMPPGAYRRRNRQPHH